MQTTGLELAHRFYDEAVAPLVTGVLGSSDEVAAGLIGPGSDVLGFDTERSRDHDWGPRCQVFLTGSALERRGAVESALALGLPSQFGGFATGFSAAEGDDRGSPGGRGVLTHRVELLDLVDWWRTWSGQSPGGERSTSSWLAVPTQRLAELTAGAVFADPTGQLTEARGSLAWYPDDVWRYVLACSWRRIAEEQPFVGRCVEAGDDLGSVLIAGRLARDVMRLWLLLERRYPPYSKWLGSAFAAVPGATDVALDLRAALTASDFPAREAALVRALTATIRRQNAAALSAEVDVQPRWFHDRPFQIVDADAAGGGLLEAITDPELVGRSADAAIDAVTDNVAVTGDITATRRMIDALRSTSG